MLKVLRLGPLPSSPASRFGLLPEHRCAFHISKKSRAGGFSCLCGPKEIRTPDPLIANEVLYQLSYGPNRTIVASFSLVYSLGGQERSWANRGSWIGGPMKDSVVQQIRAFVPLRVGMRVYFHNPFPVDDPQERRTSEKYRGRTGTIVGFAEEYVGPLDGRGRLPGVYQKPGYVDVKFEDEKKVHRSLSIECFVLISEAATLALDASPSPERLGDLPHTIRFYPGDQVRKDDDDEVRLVENVRIREKGAVEYVLSESRENREQREARLAEHKSSRRLTLGLANFGGSRAEYSDGEGLVVVSRGNVYNLYCAPDELTFSSPAEELAFFAKDGISKRHSAEDPPYPHPRSEWPLEEALEVVAKGEGDFVVKTAEFSNIVIIGRRGEYQVRIIHDCWKEYRDRIKALGQSFPEPPSEVREHRSMNDLVRDVVGI